MASCSKAQPKESYRRVVVIDLDEETDSETESDAKEVSTPSESLGMSSELSQTNSSDLNRSATDLEIDLIEEVLNEDISRVDQTIDNSQTVDENDVEKIKSFLKSDSMNWETSEHHSKWNKSKKSESKKKLINKLNEENLNLYRIVTDLTKRLDLKTKQVEEILKNRPKIICFKCDSRAVEEFFCCFNGCYCSEECKASDWITNRHFTKCLNHHKQEKSCLKRKKVMFADSCPSNSS